MNNRLKGLDFPLTLDIGSWSDRARITLASSWEQELEKIWKKLLFLAAGPVGVRGIEELRVFLSFDVGAWVWKRERASWVFSYWESQRKNKGAANKNREGRKQRSKARRTREVSGVANKSRKISWMGHVYAKGKIGWLLILTTFQNILTTPSQSYVLDRPK